MPTALARWHVIIHLNRTAKDAYALALLALLQPDVPFLRTGQAIWQSARAQMKSSASPALCSVLALPYEEALRCLDLIPRTASPIGAIAEQINLVHLNDLYSKLFVKIVEITTSPQDQNEMPNTVNLLAANLDSRQLASSLKSTTFDREIRGVLDGISRGTASHALGLVLIGLWGVLAGSIPSQQAALASALAAEEVKGANLSSVPAMLDLLYPGAALPHMHSNHTELPANAIALDKLAQVCIDYIRLLSSSPTLNEDQTRLQRLEASTKVQKATSGLRSILTQTSFVGLDEDEVENSEFEGARERLVGVLSLVGRRAAGRMIGRDEDSGLEGDMEEL